MLLYSNWGHSGKEGRYARNRRMILLMQIVFEGGGRGRKEVRWGPFSVYTP